MTNPVYLPDPTIMPALREVLASMRVELSKTLVTPAHFRLVPGLVPVFSLSAVTDECCEGIAWVRLAQFYSSDEFPSQRPTWQPEGEVSWSAVLEIGVARCGGGPGQDIQTGPTDDQYAAWMQTLADDGAALRRVGPGLARNPNSMIIDYFYGPGPWEPLGAEGNCMGGAMHLSIQVAACDAARAG